MSAQNLDVVFGVTGQTLTFDAPEGRPTSVTRSTLYESSVGDDATAETAFSGSPAIETSPNTTFDAVSGVGQASPNRCNLAATTGATVGRRYLATNALGEKEWVEVAAVAAADYVLSREPLQNDFAIGDAFATTRISNGLDATWIADTANLSPSYSPLARYRWRLAYVVASVTHVHDIGVDLVRYAARHDVTGIDVDRRFTGWLRQVGTHDREDQGADVIAEAFQHVKFDLYSLDLADQSMRTREAVNELVKLAAGAMVLNDEPTWKLYNDRLAHLVAMGKVDVQQDASGAAALVDPSRAWRR